MLTCSNRHVQSGHSCKGTSDGAVVAKETSWSGTQRPNGNQVKSLLLMGTILGVLTLKLVSNPVPSSFREESTPPPTITTTNVHVNKVIEKCYELKMKKLVHF